MKQFIIGAVVGAIAGSVATYFIAKDKIEERTISDLREELLESVKKEIYDDVDSEIVDELNEEDKADTIPEEEDKKVIPMARDYHKFYTKPEKETEEDVPFRDPDVVADEADAERNDVTIEQLSNRSAELAKTHPYEMISQEEFEHSEWDMIYDQETYVFHIPDEIVINEDNEALTYEELYDILGPDFEGVLCEKGKAHVRNHARQTEYEILASNLPVSKFDLEE